MAIGTPEELRLGQLNLRFLIDGPVSGSSLTMFEFEVAPGAKVPGAHSHDAYDETIYGLEGTLTFTLLDADGTPQTHEVTPGTSLYIPRGVPHRFDNIHATPSRSLAVITPGILGSQFFREIAVVMKSAMEAKTPPDPAILGQIMLRHGLTPAPQLVSLLKPLRNADGGCDRRQHLAKSTRLRVPIFAVLKMKATAQDWSASSWPHPASSEESSVSTGSPSEPQTAPPRESNCFNLEAD